MSKISAVDIKRLWYIEPAGYLSSIFSTNQALDAAAMARIVSSIDVSSIFHEVENVHQDTWTFEEAEGSQEFYTNQLTGKKYRAGRRTEGDTTVKFTIGQYDYETKKAILGGTLLTTGDGASQEVVGWAKAGTAENVCRGIVFKTDDEQFCFIPWCSFTANEANADKAVGLAVTATEMEPAVSEKWSSEVWYDGTLNA